MLFQNKSLLIEITQTFNLFTGHCNILSFIVECPDRGEASSAGGPVGPGVAGPSGLNMTHPDQGIQLLRL